MATTKLTEARVAAATGPANKAKLQSFLWDSACPGLGLRISAGGKKTWVVRFSTPQGDRREALAPWPEVDLDGARELARRRRRDAATGEVTRARPATLGDLAEKVLAQHAPRRSEGHARNLRDHWHRLLLPFFGAEKPLATLTYQDVERFVAAGARTPVQTNRALASLRLSLNKARKWGLLPPGSGNPADDQERHVERQTGRALTDEELADLGRALQAEPAGIPRTALTFFAFVPMRPAEVLRMKWADLNGNGLIHLPRGKTGERWAVLPSRAEELLREIPREGDFVFTGRDGAAPLSGLDNLWKRLRRREPALDAVRLYDLRHTWLSMALALDVPDDLRRLMAGHAGRDGSHGRYLHASAALRPAANRVAEAIRRKLGGE